MDSLTVEWSFRKDLDLIVDIWSTAAVVAAVIGALLEDPERVRVALRALGASGSSSGADPTAD